MTLSIKKTHLYNALICDNKALFELSAISDTDYNNLCDEIAGWITYHAADNLYGTNDDNSTFKYGVGQTPPPPPKRGS